MQIYLAVGLIERDEVTAGTLYCSLLLWSPDGELLNHHRKLKPTASERLIWGEGDNQGLLTMYTPLGRVGGLICWENYMPLARAALYNQGVELYLAPTADARESWQATIRHIALEGRCYVLSCNQYVTKADYPQDLDLASQRELAAAPDPLCRGGSAIVGPLGDYVAGPLWDEAGILYGEIDPGAITEARFDFDAAGHYSRPDIFRLTVQPPPAVTSLLSSPLLSSALLNPLLMGGDDFFGDLDDDPEPFLGPSDERPLLRLPPGGLDREERPGVHPTQAPAAAAEEVGFVGTECRPGFGPHPPARHPEGTQPVEPGEGESAGKRSEVRYGSIKFHMTTASGADGARPCPAGAVWRVAGRARHRRQPSRSLPAGSRRRDGSHRGRTGTSWWPDRRHGAGNSRNPLRSSTLPADSRRWSRHRHY